MKNLIFISLLFTFNLFFCQEKLFRHTVQKGETITQIAVKYKITPLNIYQLNPDAQSGIKPAMILLIPNKIINTQSVPKPNSVPKNEENNTISHTITTKETIYGLAVKYKTTVEAIENANPKLASDGIKIGETITIPNQKANSKNPKINENTTKITEKSKEIKPLPKPIIYINKKSVLHVVQPKETLFGIANYYEIEIIDLENANPELKDGLKIGSAIKIIGSNKTQNIKINNEAISETKVANVIPKNASKTKSYQIKPKETKYSLSKLFGITQEELVQLNPELQNGVQEGMIILYPENNSITENKSKIFEKLNLSIHKQNKKKLVLLLPFNLAKLESDSLNSTASRLKNDKFLNMTLDFYSGALLAIDSAQTLGLNLDIKIFDSQETKNSSNIQNLFEQHNLEITDVIIGPFYQNNAEKTADLLSNFKTFVISPLSKDESISTNSNLLLSNPTNAKVKETVFEFMQFKNGNVLAIIDNKKQASKQFLKEKKYIKFIPINDKNTFAADSLAQYFSKSKINYVILDSEKTGLILKTTNSLIQLQKEYQVQLVILEKNETLDFDEISLTRLTKLKMLYPSITKENLSDEANIFEKKYKLKNKILPNSFATRGFDIVFDTMLRLSQQKTFEETINETATEQIENKFQYQKSEKGNHFVNNGVYILEYQPDLTIKESK